MFFSAGDFQIHKYGQKYCLNDVVSQCKLSTNPKSYYKDVKDKTLYKGNYYINKKSLIDILTKAKAPKSKELLELLTQEKVENTVSKPIVNFVDNGNNTIHFDNKTIKYFNYNDKVYFKVTLPNGSKEGTFSKGMLVKGKIVLPDNTIETGNFKEGFLHGFGKAVHTNNSCEEGIFIKGKLVKGTKFFEGLILEGKFFEGELHGPGKRIFPDGSFEEGEFKFGILIKGTKKLFDNSIEEGTFSSSGRLDGVGKKKTGYGSIYEGTFKDGELHGHGKIIYPDGYVEEGEYENGIKK
jgi:hypothetical protein